MHRILSPLVAATLALALARSATAGGTLTVERAPTGAIEIRDHDVRVSIVDGFARTEVSQTFFNTTDVDLEGHYAFPVPRSASLSAMTILAGETRLDGEVVRRADAERIYEEERRAGNDAGLAGRQSWQRFEFRVARVPAHQETRFEFTYYQPLELDTGVGRYVYPLEDGGTDEMSSIFQARESTARRGFSFHLELDSSWPILEVGMPGHEPAMVAQRIDEGSWQVDLVEAGPTSLARDLVVYYRLADDLPGRVELLPYRASLDGPGTFLLTLTPGVDLAPLTGGSDHVFVLDVSGSMQGKLGTLKDGVGRALGKLDPTDRFRVVAFGDQAREVVPWTAATEGDVRLALQRLDGLTAGSSTNLYAGLELGLRDLDDDRATSLILVTDGVTNTGVTDPGRFADLMRSHDLRLFGFLLGNAANWPLMRTLAETSGGFYAAISNADDIGGQLELARQKVTHEALHDATLTFEGVRVFDVSTIRSKVYHGQQLVLFGRYAEPGPLQIRLAARLTGQDQVYETTATLPPIDTDHPEIERLWAMDRIEALELARDLGDIPEGEARQAIADLGVAHQIVTDETSMVVLADEAFERQGIARSNRERLERERTAQVARAGAPRPSRRVDSAQPAFPGRAHSPSSGAGAMDLASLLLALVCAGAAAGARRAPVRERS